MSKVVMILATGETIGVILGIVIGFALCLWNIRRR